MLRFTISNCSKIFNRSIRCISTGNSCNKERSFSNVQLLGRVGKDPQQSGRVIYFDMVVTHHLNIMKDDNVIDREVSDWFSVNVYEAALQEYTLRHVTKGSRIYCTGKLEVRTLKDRGGDPNGYDVTNVVVDDIMVVGMPYHHPVRNKEDERLFINQL